MERWTRQFFLLIAGYLFQELLVMGRFDFRSPQRKGYEIHRKKRAFPAVFIDIGPDGVRIAEWLKTDGGMSIAHKADGDESEAFRGVEIFESVFYLHDCGTRAAIKKIVVSPTGCAVSPCVA